MATANRRHGYPTTPQVNVTAVRPPGMNRQTTISRAPNRLQRLVRPGPGACAALSGEQPPLGERGEPAAEEVAQVVAGERAAGGQRDQYRDPRVGPARRGHPERDHHGLARHTGSTASSAGTTKATRYETGDETDSWRQRLDGPPHDLQTPQERVSAPPD